MRATGSPDDRASATRWLVRASNPAAPSSGTRSVMLPPTCWPDRSRDCAAASTASCAITR